MADIDAIKERLQQLGGRIDLWRAEAQHLRSQAAETSSADAASTDDLVKVENTAGDIYAEIESFKKTVAEIGETSPAAAGELASVGETLRLLLLEITEQGTRLYSSRSGLTDPAVEPGPGAA